MVLPDNVLFEGGAGETIRNDTIEDSATLPVPGVIAQEITEDLEAAQEQFAEIVVDLKKQEWMTGSLAGVPGLHSFAFMRALLTFRLLFSCEDFSATPLTLPFPARGEGNMTSCDLEFPLPRAGEDKGEGNCRALSILVAAKGRDKHSCGQPSEAIISRHRHHPDFHLPG